MLALNKHFRGRLRARLAEAATMRALGVYLNTILATFDDVKTLPRIRVFLCDHTCHLDGFVAQALTRHLKLRFMMFVHPETIRSHPSLNYMGYRPIAHEDRQTALQMIEEAGIDATRHGRTALWSAVPGEIIRTTNIRYIPGGSGYIAKVVASSEPRAVCAAVNFKYELIGTVRPTVWIKVTTLPPEFGRLTNTDQQTILQSSLVDGARSLQTEGLTSGYSSNYFQIFGSPVALVGDMPIKISMLERAIGRRLLPVELKSQPRFSTTEIELVKRRLGRTVATALAGGEFRIPTTPG